MPQALTQLIYTSLATAPCEPESVAEIAEQAVVRNREIGVTGILLMSGGRFIQLIEGEEDAIAMLYQRIAQDRRHHRCHILLHRCTDERLFPSWGMGHLCLGDATCPTENHDTAFLQSVRALERDPNDPDRAINVIRRFVSCFGDAYDLKSFDAWIVSSRVKAA